MSHFTLRMGNLFHFHPLARRDWLSQSRSVDTPPSRGGREDQAYFRNGDDLDFFGLCLETRSGDPGAELDRFSLSSEDGLMESRAAGSNPLLL